MPFTAIFHDIESAEFAWTLSLSGSRVRAMDALVRAPQVRALMEAMKGRTHAADVANRTLDLLGGYADSRYTHPFDAAIAAYLRALDILFPDLALVVGRFTALSRNNLWWSVPVIALVLRGQSSKVAADTRFEFIFRSRQERAPSRTRTQQAVIVALHGSPSGQACIGHAHVEEASFHFRKPQATPTLPLTPPNIVYSLFGDSR